MKIVKKDSGIYWVEFLDAAGKRRRLSTKAKEPLMARRAANALVAEENSKITSSLPRQPASKGLTVAALLDRCRSEVWQNCRSQPTIKSNVKILKQYLGNEPVASIGFSRLDRLRLQMFDDKYAAGTVKRKLNALGTALSMATCWEDAEGRPLLAAKPRMPSVEVRNLKDRVITEAEEAVIFAAVATRAEREPMRDWKRFGFLLVFLRDTGCRLGEATAAEVSNVIDRDVSDGRTIKFLLLPRYSTKNGKPRELPLTTAICETLPYLTMNAHAGSLFPYKGSTAWAMWNSIREDLKGQGIDIGDVVLHTWRHTCLTRLARKGNVRIEQISDWAGHSSLQVTMDRYRHMLPEDKLSVLDALNAK